MNKKLKAAISAVLIYLEEEKKNKKGVRENSQWALSGRMNIMKNRDYVQKRGKTLGLKRT